MILIGVIILMSGVLPAFYTQIHTKSGLVMDQSQVTVMNLHFSTIHYDHYKTTNYQEYCLDLTFELFSPHSVSGTQNSFFNLQKGYLCSLDIISP